MIGQLSEIDAAAIGIATRTLFVATIVLGIIIIGGALLVAQYSGAKDQKSVTESTALTWLTSSIFVCLMVVLFCFS